MDRMFWIGFFIIRLIAYGLVGYVYLKLSMKLLEIRKGKLYEIIIFIFFATISTANNWIGDENTLFFIPVYLILFIMCFKGSILSKSVVSISFFTLIVPVGMVVGSYDFFTGFIQSYQLESFLKALVYLSFGLILNRLVGDYKIRLSSQLWGLISGILIGPFFAIIGLSRLGIGQAVYSSKIANETIYRIAFIILPFVVMTGIAVFMVIVLLSKHEEARERENLAIQRETYYEGLKSEQELIRTMRHDMKNHLLSVQNYISKDNTDAAREYIEKLTESPAFRQSRQISNNDVVNAIMDSKMETMAESGIELDYKIGVPEILPISDVDISALLGNALDNAIEATEKCVDKKITMRLRADKGLFMLMVKNPFSGEIIEENGRFMTIKKDKENHGFGLISISDVVKLYNGTMETKVENGEFELILSIPI